MSKRSFKPVLSSVRKFVSSRTSTFLFQCNITLFLGGVIFKFRVSVVPKMTIVTAKASEWFI